MSPKSKASNQWSCFLVLHVAI